MENNCQLVVLMALGRVRELEHSVVSCTPIS